MQLYTVAQMREAERRAVAEYGIPLAELMDNAGKGLACASLEMLPQPDSVIGVFCGNGNNGGDGYVCATELLRRGRRVTLWGIGAENLPDGSLVKNAADAYLATGGEIFPVTTELAAEDVKCDLIVDALLGTGLTRQVSGLYAHAVGLINAACARVLSCDLPSGVDADAGKIMGIAVKADKTLMMGLSKLACALPPGCTCFGQLEACDIGLPPELIARFEPARNFEPERSK
jgi:NAD(P)H-hydrate epimerase